MPNVAKKIVKTGNVNSCENSQSLCQRVFVADNENVSETDDFQLKRCREHASIWKNIEANNPDGMKTGAVKVLPTILDAVEFISQNAKCDILITGSLHLVGSALSVIQEKESQGLSSCAAY